MKTKVIMLETTNKSGIWKHAGELHCSNNEFEDWKKYIQLYLINESAEIKEGDWCYNTITKQITQARTNYYGNFNWKKIIASTQQLEGIPQLSEQSIKLLVDYYNTNSKMPEFVEVDYEYVNRPMSDLFLDKKLKLN